MAFTFKLANPNENPSKGVCQVPQWMEEHLSQVSSEFDADTLGRVNISLIRNGPFNYTEQSEMYGNYYNYHNLPSTQSVPAVQVNQPINSLQEFHNDVSNGGTVDDSLSSTPAHYEKPIHPKTFCDNLYMRLVSLLYSIGEEDQAAQAQSRIDNLVSNLERTFLRQ